MKRALLFSLIAMLSRPAAAHLAIDVNLYAPTGTRYRVYTNDGERTGNMPGTYLFLEVVGYYAHGAGDTVYATFVGPGGDSCPGQFTSIYEPQWHYAQSCTPTFRYDGATCTSSCEVNPIRPPAAGAAPKAFPNPLKEGDDAVRFMNLPALAHVRIYGPTGRLVYEKDAGIDGTMHWHTDDSQGRMVGSGIYFVVAHNDGKTVKLKVAIQR